jgi:HEAT repeat protein
MKLLTLAVITAMGTGAVLGPAAAPNITVDRNIPAASWAPRDTADSLWRTGRIAISDESWERAADAFRSIVDRYPKSAYAGDALYWEAFALQRLGRQSDLRRAQSALERQKEDYATAATFSSGESSALLARVNGRLARTGDREAAIAVSEMAAQIAEVTASSVSQGLAAAAAALATVGPEMQRSMVEARRDMSEAAREQSTTARAMARGMARSGADPDDSDVPPGCEGKVGGDRIEALNALMQMNAEQALPILKKVLERRDECSEVLRRKAVFLVSQKRSEDAVDILLSTAKSDPDRKTREQAVFWLSQTHSDRAVEVLEQILLKEAPDEEMQKKAVFSLSQSRTDRAQRILRDFVRRSDAPEEVRSEAIFWLGQNRNAENAAFLREIFPTLKDQELREKVIFAISQSRSPENSQFLIAQAKNRTLDTDMRKSALFWAGQSGAATKDLAEIYDTAGNEMEVREQVVFVLSQRKDEAAIDKLLEIARKEPDRELRRQAIFWLGQSHDPRVAKLLEEIINK